MYPSEPQLWALLRGGRRIRRWLLRQGLRTRPSSRGTFRTSPFCSSVKVFSKSSWCLAMYPSSSFISFELFLLSSCGMMFPCHSSFIIFFIGCASFSVSTTTYHRRERKSSTFSKINPTFFVGRFLWLQHLNFCILKIGVDSFPEVWYTNGRRKKLDMGWTV